MAKSLRLRKNTGDEGYVLIAVLFMVAMVLVLLSIAAPKMAADIERDREIELMHRGHQYERAIKLYYKKFGAYPPNMETLEKVNEIRFLRKRYKDPATGKDEWHLIHFGENKTPTAMGFFGQPLGGVGGSTLAGIGPGSAGNIGLSDPNASNTATANSSTATPADPNASNPAAGNANGGGTNTTSGTNSTAGSAFGSSSTTGNNQTFGGGGIIGVESTSPKATILEYKKKKHFNEWEFVYDPNADRIMMGGNTGTIGQPMGNGPNGISSPSQSNGPANSPIPPSSTQTPSQPQPNPQQ